MSDDKTLASTTRNDAPKNGATPRRTSRFPRPGTLANGQWETDDYALISGYVAVMGTSRHHHELTEAEALALLITAYGAATAIDRIGYWRAVTKADIENGNVYGDYDAGPGSWNEAGTGRAWVKVAYPTPEFAEPGGSIVTAPERNELANQRRLGPSQVDGNTSHEPFVLDLDSNPHQRMLDAAIRHRRLAHQPTSHPDSMLGIIWLTYLDAMCDATGLPPEQIDAWVVHHDPLPELSIAPRSVPVEVRR